MILSGFEGEEDSYRMKILLSNRIRGLLPLTVEHVDGEVRLCFEITGLQSFASFCECAHPTKEMLKKMYSGLLDSLAEYEDYLLDPEQLLLDPEYMYIDWSQYELYFPYLPQNRKKDIYTGLAGLTEYILSKLGHSDQSCVVLLCRLLHELQEPNLQLADLRRALGKTDVGESEREREWGAMPASGLPEYEESYHYSGDSIFQGSEVDFKNYRERYSDDADELGKKPWSDSQLLKFPGAGEREEKGISGRKDDSSEKKTESFGFEEKTVLKAEKRSFLPEKDTLLSAAGMAAAAAAVWLVLNLQNFYEVTTAQMAGGCLIGASAFLLISLAVIRSRNDRKVKEALEKRNKGIFEEKKEETDQYRRGCDFESGAVFEGRTFAGSEQEDLWRRNFHEDTEKRGLESGENKDAAVKREKDSGEEYDGFVRKDFAGSELYQYDGRNLSQMGGEQEPFVYWDEMAEGYDAEVSSGETVLLSELTVNGSRTPASMVPVSTDKGLRPFAINSDDVLVGHRASLVDQVIADSTVSRIHARIFRKNGNYYVSDMGSKNGTSVDGKPVIGREEIQLQEGRHVKFADCEYVFHDGRIAI